MGSINQEEKRRQRAWKKNRFYFIILCRGTKNSRESIAQRRNSWILRHSRLPNFLENNDAAEAADIVVNTLLNIPEEVRTQAKVLLVGRSAAQRFIKDLKQAKWLIFSDTILLALPYDAESPPEGRFSQWASFLMSSILLQRTMFDHGLPLPGLL